MALTCYMIFLSLLKQTHPQTCFSATRTRKVIQFVGSSCNAIIIHNIKSISSTVQITEIQRPYQINIIFIKLNKYMLTCLFFYHRKKKIVLVELQYTTRLVLVKYFNRKLVISLIRSISSNLKGANRLMKFEI